METEYCFLKVDVENEVMQFCISILWIRNLKEKYRKE